MDKVMSKRMFESNGIPTPRWRLVAHDGPAESVCADYRRKLPWATPDVLRQRQARDAVELAHLRHEWAADATVTVFRCEVGASHAVTFRPLDAARELEGSAWGEPFVHRRK